MHEPKPPVVNDRGYETHPAFGMISAVRVTSSTGQTLFDSDVQHRQTIRVTVEQADRRRDLNRDWIHGGKRLIEVEMSEAQWASFVSSMNTSGVPVTIRATEAVWDVPGLTYEPRLAHSMREVRTKARETFEAIDAALAEYERLVEAKAGARERREALRHLRSVVTNTEGNIAYAAHTLNEHAENVVQKARADIEAMVSNEVARLGLESGQAKLLELPGLPGETPG